MIKISPNILINFLFIVKLDKTYSSFKFKNYFSDLVVIIKKTAIVMYELVNDIKKNAQKSFLKTNVKSSNENCKQGK